MTLLSFQEHFSRLGRFECQYRFNRYTTSFLVMKLLQKKVDGCHLIDCDCSESPKHVFGPKSATSARMPKHENPRLESEMMI